MATTDFPADLRSSVQQAIEETLEGMAFTAVYDPAEMEDPPTADTLPAYTRIGVLHPKTGQIRMEMTPELGKKLTEAMYGFLDEEDLTETATTDALKELANTFAGRLCATVCGEGTAFEVGLPEASLSDEDEGAAEEWPAADFVVEGELLRIRLQPSLWQV